MNNEELKPILDYIISSVKGKIVSRIEKVTFEEPGEYEWVVPEGVHQLIVTASAGGASGEGIDSELSVVGENGEDTTIENLTIKGGELGTVPPKDDYENDVYSGGEGEDSPFGKGGNLKYGESAWTLDGAKGSGGMGASHESGSGFGGGAGDYVIDHAIEVTPLQKIKIKVGKGGMSDIDNNYLHPAGKGGDGFVHLQYIETFIDL